MELGQARELALDLLKQHNLEYRYRFYMNEYKAKNAEEVYAASTIDTTKIAYALVATKNGEAVIKDVLIDNISIKELAKANNNTNK